MKRRKLEKSNQSQQHNNNGNNNNNNYIKEQKLIQIIDYLKNNKNGESSIESNINNNKNKRSTVLTSSKEIQQLASSLAFKKGFGEYFAQILQIDINSRNTISDTNDSDERKQKIDILYLNSLIDNKNDLHVDKDEHNTYLTINENKKSLKRPIDDEDKDKMNNLILTPEAEALQFLSAKKTVNYSFSEEQEKQYSESWNYSESSNYTMLDQIAHEPTIITTSTEKQGKFQNLDVQEKKFKNDNENNNNIDQEIIKTVKTIDKYRKTNSNKDIKDLSGSQFKIKLGQLPNDKNADQQIINIENIYEKTTTIQTQSTNYNKDIEANCTEKQGKFQNLDVQKKQFKNDNENNNNIDQEIIKTVKTIDKYRKTNSNKDIKDLSGSQFKIKLGQLPNDKNADQQIINIENIYEKPTTIQIQSTNYNKDIEANLPNYTEKAEKFQNLDVSQQQFETDQYNNNNNYNYNNSDKQIIFIENCEKPETTTTQKKNIFLSCLERFVRLIFCCLFLRKPDSSAESEKK